MIHHYKLEEDPCLGSSPLHHLWIPEHWLVLPSLSLQGQAPFSFCETLEIGEVPSLSLSLSHHWYKHSIGWQSLLSILVSSMTLGREK